MEKLTKAFSADIAIEDGERAIVATMTTNAVDRAGEVLKPEGMDATNYQKNPVVMLSHSYDMLPFGKVTAIKRGPNKWSAKIVPASRPENHPQNLEWLPDTVYSLFKQGVMNAVSIGLMPKEMRDATKKDLEDFGPEVKRVVSKFELLELSVCAIPCNPEAVATAIGKGITQSDESVKIFGKAAEEKEETPEEVKEDEKPEEKKDAEEQPPTNPDTKTEEKSAEPSADRIVVHTVDPPTEEKATVVNYVIHRPRPERSIEKAVIARMGKRAGRVYN